MQKYLKTVAFILILVWAVVALKTLEIENKNRIIDNINLNTINSLQSNNLKETIISTVKTTVPLFNIGNNAYGSCTGVILENNADKAVILTAKHCIDKKYKIFADTLRSSKNIISDKYDLALIILSHELVGKTSVVLAKEDVKDHTAIYTIGFPMLEVFIDIGETLMYNNDGLLVAHMKVIGGCSGGGVFNTKGDLIGINVRAIDNSRISFFEPLDHIKDFLRVN